jgi:hypothetical protein
MFGLDLADIPNIRYLLTFPTNGHALAVSLSYRDVFYEQRTNFARNCFTLNKGHFVLTGFIVIV